MVEFVLTSPGKNDTFGGHGGTSSDGYRLFDIGGWWNGTSILDIFSSGTSMNDIVMAQFRNMPVR